MTYLIISAEEQNTNTSVMLIALSCAKGDQKKYSSLIMVTKGAFLVNLQSFSLTGSLHGRSTSN